MEVSGPEWQWNPPIAKTCLPSLAEVGQSSDLKPATSTLVLRLNKRLHLSVTIKSSCARITEIPSSTWDKTKDKGNLLLEPLCERVKTSDSLSNLPNRPFFSNPPQSWQGAMYQPAGTPETPSEPPNKNIYPQNKPVFLGHFLRE